MSSEDILFQALQNGEVFFFAGAGVSMESGLVMPNDAIEFTCRKLLPSFIEEPELLIGAGTRTGNVIGSGTKGIQPELFYSALLDCCHNNHCLDVWKSLMPSSWEEYNKTTGLSFNPSPNINHLFIVNYSHYRHIPIFTTNFDSMFELAANQLGIGYQVLTHNDDPNVIDNKKLYICKVHGSIPESGEITPNDICTTLNMIAAENRKWLQCIDYLLESKHLCLIGYSGRDVDYFPNLCTMTRNDKAHPPIWIPARDDVTRKKAAMLRAEVIETYPSKFFKDHFSSTMLWRSEFNLIAEPDWNVLKDAKGQFLKFISDRIDQNSEIKFNPDVVWPHLMIVSGNIAEAARCICFVEGKKLLEQERLLYQNDRGVILREQADFPAYRKIYKRIQREEWGVKMNAKLQIISSYQMEIPQTHDLHVPKRMLLGRRPELLAYVIISYARLLKGIDKAVMEHDEEFYKENIVIIQESKVRNLANYIAIQDSNGIPSRVKAIIFKFYIKHCATESVKGLKNPVDVYGTELEQILNNAKNYGNYSTVNSCYKYFGRDFLKDYADNHHIFEDTSIASMYHDVTQDISAESIDLGYSKNASDIKRAIGRAVQNDNVLNVVKFILSYARQKKNDHDPLYAELEKHKTLFKRYLNRIRPRRLRRFYGKLGKLYLGD